MIDAHIHFWDPSRFDDILIVRREPSLGRRYMPAELLPLMRNAGVESAVAIQSAPDPSETDHLLATSESVVQVRAVVGWVDLTAADCAQRIEALVRRPKFVGVRAMLNRVEGRHWLSSDRVQAGLAAVAAAGLSLDLIARTEHIASILAVATRFPSLRIVVDHGATAPIGRDGYRAWQEGIAALARQTSVVTKFSGLAEEAAADWSPDTLEPAFRHLLAHFGSERIMWASNWPVIDLRGGYQGWITASRTLMKRAGLSERETSLIESEVAARIYRRPPSVPAGR